MIRYSKEVPMIHLVTEENKEVFYKLTSSICGGLSLVFHRHHEKNKTKIKRPVYENNEWREGTEGKTVKNIVGFDANALYLWCLGQEMPCGELKVVKTDDMKYVYDEKFFGFLEVDIEVPKQLYNYFAELPPIVKNIEYDETICGAYTNSLLKKLNKKPNKTKKLIATMKGEKILMKSTRLRWLLSKGCVVTKLHSVIPAIPRKCFEGFVDWVSNERRKGDKDTKYAIIAEAAKTVGNSAFGHTIMNKAKHKKVKLCDKRKFDKYKNLPRFYDSTLHSNEIFEVTMTKKACKQNTALMIGCSVFDDSKLRMYQFYYDFIDKFIDRSDFQYIEMDTDSAYMALTNKNLDRLVKPNMREEYDKQKYNWFCRNDTKEVAAYEKRIPGKFKIEYEGDGMVALCSKSYITWDKTQKSKVSCKGAQKSRNKYNNDDFITTLLDGNIKEATNMGFRVVDNTMKTYKLHKVGLTPVYNKGIVLNDKISIVPLDI